MPRCTRTYNLEVHHKNKNGDNSLSNAEVLCFSCHTETDSFGKPNPSPLPFSEETKKKALARAGNRCECTRTGGCH